MLLLSQTLPVVLQMVIMELVSQLQNVKQKEAQHLEPVLPHLESAVSSPSHVVVAAVLIIPMLS